MKQWRYYVKISAYSGMTSGCVRKRVEKIDVEENFEVDVHGWCIEHILTAN